MIKKLDWYVLKKFLVTFFYTIMIFAIIACVIDYSQKVDDFVKNKAPFLQIMFYFMNFIPQIVALLSPLFIFIAAIFFTSRMAYRSEIIAALATGTSFQRFLRPYLLGGIFLGLLSLLINHWVVPIGNKNIHEFSVKYIWNKRVKGDDNTHLRLSKNEYVFVANYYYNTNIGEHFTSEVFDGILLKEKITAERISYDSARKLWKLTDVITRTNNGLKETLTTQPSLERKYAFTPDDLNTDDRIKEAMTTTELQKFAKTELKRGRQNVNVYLFELHRRTSDAFAGIVLTIIAACIASRKIRGGGGFHLVMGIVLSVVYIMFMQITKTLSINTGLNPLIAAWIPSIVFIVVALWLYRRNIR